MRRDTEKRYRDLYGGSGYEEKYINDRKALRTRYMLVAAVFILAVCFSVHEQMVSSSGVSEKDGRIISISRPGKGEEGIALDVDVSASDGETTIEKQKRLDIRPDGEAPDTDENEGIIGEESEEERLERKIDAAVRSANTETGGKKVVLPSVLEDGTRLSWGVSENSDIPMLIAGFVIMMLLIYKTGDSGIERAEKEARDSVSRDMPGFMNKMLLLVNGGLVLTEAFDRAVSDADARNTGEKSFFYGQLTAIRNSVSRSNGSMHEELAALAQRSGVRELMRFSNLVSDNIEKGADISEKLAAESRMLWFLRKKRAEEAGRLAETKLTIPLMILILDLIMVTCAPALMQM